MKPGGILALLRVGEVGVSEIEDRRLAICDAMIMCGGRGRGERWSCAERDLYTVCLAITEAGIRGRSCGLQLHSRGKRQRDPTTQSGKVLFSDNQIYLLVFVTELTETYQRPKLQCQCRVGSRRVSIKHSTKLIFISTLCCQLMSSFMISLVPSNLWAQLHILVTLVSKPW